VKIVLSVLALCAAVYAAPALAQGAEGSFEPEMAYIPLHSYLVSTSHAPDQCLAALDEMAAKTKRTFKKMRWGCKAGDHTGYMIVDTTDAETARMMLPESARASAKVIELTKITPKQLKDMHVQPATAGQGSKGK
jgi:hypothetical protein